MYNKKKFLLFLYLLSSLTQYLICYCQRLGKLGLSKKKEIFVVLFWAPLFLGKWYGVVTFFLYKK